MAVDSTPAYGPSRSFTSSSISDSTAAGRSMLTAADAAAQRALLSISDVTTFESQSVAHAKSVCNFAFSPTVLSISALQKYGSAGSGWPSNILSASSTAVPDQAGEYGGSTLFTTSGLSGGQVQWLSISNGLGVFAPCAMPDLVAAASRWHLEFDFRLNSTPDAQTFLGTGWIDPGGTATIMLGVNGNQAKFQLWKGFAAGGAGTNSTVSVNTARHRARMWANGGTPGTIYFSIDGETPIAVAGNTWGLAAGPYGLIGNGTTLAAQNANMFDAVYCFEGVA